MFSPGLALTSVRQLLAHPKLSKASVRLYHDWNRLLTTKKNGLPPIPERINSGLRKPNVGKFHVCRYANEVLADGGQIAGAFQKPAAGGGGIGWVSKVPRIWTPR